MGEFKKLKTMQRSEASHIDVLVPVPRETMYGEADAFRRKHLENGPGADECSPEDLELMAGAFVALAGSLPITNEDFLDWLVSSPAFGGKAMLVDYAKRTLGMRFVAGTGVDG